MSCSTTRFYKDSLLYFDEKEENTLELLLNINFKQLQHISKVKDFSEISFEEGLKDVQSIREFLIATKEMYNENEKLTESSKSDNIGIEGFMDMDKAELRMLVKSQMQENIELREQMNSLRQLNDKQLLELESKNLAMETVKNDLFDNKRQLKELYVLIDSKSAEEDFLIENLRHLSVKFEHVYQSVDEIEKDYQSQFDNLVAQSAELERLRVELIATTNQLNQSNDRLREKEAKEQFLLGRMLELSQFLDEIHRLASEYETASNRKLDTAHSEITDLKYQLKRCETNLLAAREELLIADEAKSELSRKQDLIDLYHDRIRVLEERLGDDNSSSGFRAELAQPATLSAHGSESESDQRVRRQDEELKRKNEELLHTSGQLESIVYYYEELKLRYRTKRFQMSRLELEKKQVQDSYDSLRRVCVEKGWIE